MQLSLIGLGLTTTSMALALKRATSEITIVGNDPDPLLSARAKKLEAVDKIHWNLPALCENADMIIIDVGLSELGKTLQVIRQDLKEDVVIIALSSVPSSVLSVQDMLPETANLIGALPISPAFAFPEHLDPSVDWLVGIPVFLAISACVSPSAADRASTLVSAFGAIPRFADAAELDGMAAVGEQLPLVIALSLAAQFQNVSGEHDRLAASGGQLALLGAALQAPETEVAQDWIANRAVLVPAIDVCIQELESIKRRIQTEDEQELVSELKQAAKTGMVWVTGEEEDDSKSSVPRPSGWLRTLFLGGSFRRRSTDEN